MFFFTIYTHPKVQKRRHSHQILTIFLFTIVLSGSDFWHNSFGPKKHLTNGQIAPCPTKMMDFSMDFFAWILSPWKIQPFHQHLIVPQKSMPATKNHSVKGISALPKNHTFMKTKRYKKLLRFLVRKMSPEDPNSLVRSKLFGAHSNPQPFQAITVIFPCSIWNPQNSKG